MTQNDVTRKCLPQRDKQYFPSRHNMPQIVTKGRLWYTVWYTPLPSSFSKLLPILTLRTFNPVAAGSSPAPSTSFSFVCKGERAVGRGHRILCGLPGPRPVRSARIANGLPGLALHQLFHSALQMRTFGITKSDEPDGVHLHA